MDVKDPTVSFTKNRRAIASIMNKLQILEHFGKYSPMCHYNITWYLAITRLRKKGSPVVYSGKRACLITTFDSRVEWDIRKGSSLQIYLFTEQWSWPTRSFVDRRIAFQDNSSGRADNKWSGLRTFLHIRIHCSLSKIGVAVWAASPTL